MASQPGRFIAHLPGVTLKPDDLAMAQSNVKKILDELAVDRRPLMGCELLTITLIIGTNVLAHKLGRKLQGWFQVGGSRALGIDEVSSDDVWLTLTATTAGSVTLIIF